MRGSTIRTIYAKEIRDLLRDRRTVISTIVIPTVVMPLIVFGFISLASKIVTQARSEVPRVMMIGGADSPGIRSKLETSGKFRMEKASPDWKDLISDKRIRAAIEIPDGFDKALDAGSAPAITLYHYQGEMKSGLAVDQLQRFLTDLRNGATAKLLSDKGLPATIAKPFEVREVNVAPPEKVGGNLFGGIVPYFIIILCMSGAMYPAMDLTAGEKERGTMEMLLCSPAARTDIVLGKFLTVLTGSISAVVFSLTSMFVTLVFIGPALAVGAALIPRIAPLGILGVLGMVTPVAVLFSAILFTTSLFAKSFKEAQSYVTPMMMVVIMPAIAGMLPGVELNYRLAMVPILNISLVSKEMLSGVWHWNYIAMIFGSTALYAAVALAVAVRMFKREDVIFRA
ncbi:MAG TPA: ABC transporter permease [Opitutaceae bacterium]